MTAAPNSQPTAQDQRLPKRQPATERLESALGGDLMRFLLTALAAPPSARPEPR